MTPGNVDFDHAQGLSITDSTFQHLGAAGLQLGRSVAGSALRGNIFRGTWSGAIGAPLLSTSGCRPVLPGERLEDVAALAVHLVVNEAFKGATYDIDGGWQFVGG